MSNNKPRKKDPSLLSNSPDRAMKAQKQKDKGGALDTLNLQAKIAPKTA